MHTDAVKIKIVPAVVAVYGPAAVVAKVPVVPIAVVTRIRMPEQGPPWPPVRGVIVPVPGRVPDAVRRQINILHQGPACYSKGSGLLYRDYSPIYHLLVTGIAGVGSFRR